MSSLIDHLILIQLSLYDAVAVIVWHKCLLTRPVHFDLFKQRNASSISIIFIVSSKLFLTFGLNFKAILINVEKLLQGLKQVKISDQFVLIIKRVFKVASVFESFW